MSETFLAVPSEIGGLSVLVKEIGEDCTAASNYIAKNGPAADWLSGPIIDELIPYIEAAATATQRRMGDIAIITGESASELKTAAWMYHSKDQQTYEALNKHKVNLATRESVPVSSDQESAGYTLEYEGSASYPKAENVDLAVPTANKEDTAALIAEVFPPLGQINDAIKSITRMAGNEIDVMGKALNPIPGNWNEVRRIGEAYKIAGNAMEASGKNLDAGLAKVDPHWDGKARLAFGDWAVAQSAAMKWEGPVGRIIADILGLAADKIRNAVKWIIEQIKKLLESRIKITSLEGALRFVANKIPVVGTANEIREIGTRLYEIIKGTIDMVLEITKLRDQIMHLLEVIKDPAAAGKAKVTEVLEQKIQPYLKRAAVADDVAKIANLNSTLNRPKNDFEVGSGRDPWADA
ncbi:hypothetical protein AB0H76_29905 [Nocardia sp. NPDC050712]|uniref:hypothetical protein n=1 Tax=Nocardia sp. NPDC050712 TaxID=3155518 RepID=UPI0033D22607